MCGFVFGDTRRAFQNAGLRGWTIKPSETYEAIADIVTQAVKRPFRDEPITPAEWDVITDKILQFAEEQKKQAGYDPLSEFIGASRRVAEAMKRIGGAK